MHPPAEAVSTGLSAGVGARCSPHACLPTVPTSLSALATYGWYVTEESNALTGTQLENTWQRKQKGLGLHEVRILHLFVQLRSWWEKQKIKKKKNALRSLNVVSRFSCIYSSNMPWDPNMRQTLRGTDPQYWGLPYYLPRRQKNRSWTLTKILRDVHSGLSSKSGQWGGCEGNSAGNWSMVFQESLWKEYCKSL